MRVADLRAAIDGLPDDQWLTASVQDGYVVVASQRENNSDRPRRVLVRVAVAVAFIEGPFPAEVAQ